MPHWKLTLAYDGTPYNGWQIQPNLPTIQGTLANAIHHITGETVLPQGSGRTDTGVHALAQVATVTLATPIPGPNLHRALNRILPPSIRVLAIDQVPEDFHARHSARRKTYEYRILPGNRICSPMLAPYVWAFQRPLDLAILQQAATYVIGTHDFTSFAATNPELSTRTQSEEDEEVAQTHAGSSQSNPSVISTGGGALAAGVEKPASLPRALRSCYPDHHSPCLAIATLLLSTANRLKSTLLSLGTINSAISHWLSRLQANYVTKNVTIPLKSNQ